MPKKKTSPRRGPVVAKRIVVPAPGQRRFYGHGIPNEGKTGSGGRGLIGMRERVNLVKGEFQAGNDPNGGFRIKVKLPLGEQR